MKYANENAYDAIISAAIAKNGNVAPMSLVKAMIGLESEYNPKAFRAEVKIGDASRGLMQLLLKTARSLGYMGTADGLYDPATNIGLGVKFLSDLIRSKNGDVSAAISAYNNGNGRRAAVETTTCLARDNNGVCIKTFTAAPGQFLNQPYVDKVLSLVRYFDGDVPDVSGVGAGNVVAFVALGGVLWLATRRRH